MKKFLLPLLMALPLMGIQAAEVSQQRAAAIAQTMVADRVDGFDTEVLQVRTVSYEGRKAYHVVQFKHGGWALISADDLSTPLIGYSGEGTFAVEGQPENVEGMMEWYSQQVVDNARRGGQQHAGWAEASRPVSARSAQQRAAADIIEPLIKICWNQTGSYQKYCPSNASGKAVVGCVAVGMAQAMSVAKWPDRPVGSFGYTSENFGSLYIDYDSEPEYNWNAILSGANSLDDVARLLYHCGVAVKMDYGVDGSGSQTAYIASALQRNFKYPQSVKYYSRGSYSGDWNELILTELKEGRAVAYSGADPKKNYGHCFNLDGYDGAYYHVNWGWGSPNSYNGYYALDGLKDTRMDCNYTEQQGVVVGIRQPSEKPSDIILSHTAVQALQPAGTEVADVYVESEAEAPTYEFKVVGPYNVIFHRNMPAPFEVKDGKLVTTEELSLDDGDRDIEITATNTKNKGSVTRHFVIQVTATNGIRLIETAPAVVSEKEFSLSGVHTASAAKGVSIVRQRMADGSTRSVKKVVK